MRILITAGGTREYIDPVRFISNASTGRMGYALAQAARNAGHEVVLITAPAFLKKPDCDKIIDVETSAEMFKAVKEHFTDCDCLIMAAAVSDYKPAKQSKTKIKKLQAELLVQLKPTQDILKWAGRNKSGKQIVVGFALEDQSLKKNAEKKLRQKKLDMIVANSLSAIGAEKSSVYIKTVHSDWAAFEEKSKHVTAKRIMKIVESF